MSFQKVLSEELAASFGNSISLQFYNYCTAEKLSDEDLRCDLLEMSYKWSISEVFLIDIALLTAKSAKRVYNCMKETAQGYEFPLKSNENANVSPLKINKPSNVQPKGKKSPRKSPRKSPKKSSTPVKSNSGIISNDNQNKRLNNAQFIPNASSGGGICITNEDTFVNVIIKANTHSKFTSWQMFEYSHESHFVDKLMVGSRMETSKIESGELKVALKKFAFVKVNEPFQYRLAVRCKSNKSEDAQQYLDIIKAKIDEVLSTVTRLETFKYGSAMDQIMQEIMA